MTYEYPKHLSDPIRKEVATNFVWHEFKKIFPSIQDINQWESIYIDILNWHSTESYPKSIRSFWNDVNAVTYHFKLKDIVPLFTSANISWKKINIENTQLTFNTEGPEFDVINDNPKTVLALVDFYNKEENKELKRKAIEKLQAKEADSAERDTDPIIAIKEKDSIVIIDGNRRVLKNSLLKNKYIQATYMGEILSKEKYKDIWVPTTEILKLVNQYRKSVKEECSLAEHFACVLAFVVLNSDVAQYELETRYLNISDEDDRIILDLVKKYILDLSGKNKQ